MNRFTKKEEHLGARPGRMLWIVGVVLLVCVAAFFRMRSMMVKSEDSYAATAQTKSTKTLTVYGMRGTIYDTNMVPLAYDRTSYNVAFYRDPSKASEAYRASYTQVILKTIELVEAMGKSTVSDFWLVKNDKGQWVFDTGSGSETVETKRKTQWAGNFYLTNYPEDQWYDLLLEKYQIPSGLDEETIVKVLAVWQASRMSAYTSQPVVIAEDVGFECVTRIEAMAVDLDGISVQTSSQRVYPQGSTACHAIGYVSKIYDDASMETYKAKGYPNDATVGVAGIEYSMEDQLSQYVVYRQGQRQVEVDTRGKVVREISYTEPQDGSSVVLTIDVERDEVPAVYGPAANVKNSIVADGCVINGTVENCILFSGVKIGRGTVVKNSILFQDSYIEDNAELEYVILDKVVTIRTGGRLIGQTQYPIVIGKNVTL